MNLSNIKALILDMDGVLWHDNTPIGDLPAIFARIHERGLKVAMATNNATRSVDEHLEKLAGFGVKLKPWQIISSALAAVDVLAKRFNHSSPAVTMRYLGIQDKEVHDTLMNEIG